MHLIHRNRVRKSLQVFAFFFRCGLICLQISSHSGARLSARILFVRLTVTVKAMIVSVLLALIDKDNRNKPCPAGEGGPQRRDISREIREMIDAVAVDEVHHADAPSPKRTFSCKTNQIHRQNRAECMTQPLYLFFSLSLKFGASCVVKHLCLLFLLNFVIFCCDLR